MKLVKILYKRIFDGKERILPSYFIVADNGKKVLIKPFNKYDYAKLDLLSEFGGFANESVTDKDIQE